MTTRNLDMMIGESDYYLISAAKAEVGDIVFWKDLDAPDHLVLRGIIQTVAQAQGSTYDTEKSADTVPVPLMRIVFYNPSTQKTSEGYFDTYETFEIIRPPKHVRPAYK